MRFVPLFLLVSLMIAPSAVAQIEVDSRMSGSWYQADRSGEGFVIQILQDSGQKAAPTRAIITWFTYTPGGEQAWILGVGTVLGSRIEVTEMRITSGGVFGPDFDPASVTSQIWGSLIIEFLSCTSATLTYIGPTQWGTGEYQLSRLSELAGLDCANDPISQGLRSARSGPYFDPSHDGEGWMVETLNDGRVIIYWFTYDNLGRQVWLIGVGQTAGDNVWVREILRPQGARFGENFDPDDVQVDIWGEFGFAYDGCAAGVIRYLSDIAEFGSGSLEPRLITPLDQSNCDDPPPVPEFTALWGQGPSLPSGFGSEGASRLLDGAIYATGGSPSGTSNRRLVVGSSSWEARASLPAFRHHHMLTTWDGQLHLLGGYSAAIHTGPSPSSNHWRYDPATDQWQVLDPMPATTGAGSAVTLNDRIHVLGGIPPRHMAWDPRRDNWEILPHISFQSDHHKSRVYRGEIWMVGGRSPGVANSVRIYNPITQAWREGPVMNQGRSGHGLAVIGDYVIATGGETLEPNPALTPATEIYSPNTNQWTLAPGAPMPVHGSDALSVNGSLWLIGGSPLPGQVDDVGAIQVYTPD